MSRLLAVLALALPSLVTADAWAEPKPMPKDTSYTFSVSGNTLCMDVAGGKAKDGRAVQLNSCNVGRRLSQRWQYTERGQLVAYGNMCLDGYDLGGRRGAKLMMRPCNRSKYQQWVLDEKKRGTWQVFIKSAVHGRLCVGVGSPTFKKKSQLVVLSCKRGVRVDWRASRVTSVSSMECAKKVRRLLAKHVKKMFGVNDYDADKWCENNKDDVLETVKAYMDHEWVDERRRILKKVAEELGK